MPAGELEAVVALRARIDDDVDRGIDVRRVEAEQPRLARMGHQVVHRYGAAELSGARLPHSGHWSHIAGAIGSSGGAYSDLRYSHLCIDRARVSAKSTWLHWGKARGTPTTPAGAWKVIDLRVLALT